MGHLRILHDRRGLESLTLAALRRYKPWERKLNSLRWQGHSSCRTRAVAGLRESNVGGAIIPSHSSILNRLSDALAAGIVRDVTEPLLRRLFCPLPQPVRERGYGIHRLVVTVACDNACHRQLPQVTLGGALNPMGAVRYSGKNPAPEIRSGTLAQSPLEHIAQGHLDL